METLYVLSDAKISRHDNTIRLSPKEGKARNYAVETLKHIIVVGSATFNSELATFLGKQDVRVSFLDYYGHFSSSLEPANLHASGAVHLAQARFILDEAKRLSLGKRIMLAALQNIVGNLRYYSYRGNDAIKPIIEDIQKHQASLLQATSVEQMMGCEGLSRQAYYSSWEFINPMIRIVKRQRQPPSDPVNALISFCNGLTYVACKNELAKTHLDLTLSFVHSPAQARASLSLDLAELFKPVIADKLIFGLVNRNMLADEDFVKSPGVCMLSETGRRKVVDGFRDKLDNEEIGELRGYKAVILREAFQLQKHVLEMEEYKPYIHKG